MTFRNTISMEKSATERKNNMEKLTFPDGNGMLVLSKAGTSQVLSLLGISCMRKDGKPKNLSTVLREIDKKQKEIEPQLFDALIRKLEEEENNGTFVERPAEEGFA